MIESEKLKPIKSALNPSMYGNKTLDICYTFNMTTKYMDNLKYML